MAASDASAASPAGTQKSRRGANLLRDYYGLSANNQPPPPPSPLPPAVTSDPTDPDSPAFSKDAALSSLLSTNSLSQLLSTESRLITEIRELDGERQSLVYNHHHQLVAASDTIRNMKQKSESLDPSLGALKDSFLKISQLQAGLQQLQTHIDATSQAPVATPPF